MQAARRKAKEVAEKLRAMKLKEAAKKIEDSIDETRYALLRQFSVNPLVIGHGVRGSISVLPRKQYFLDILVGDIVIQRPGDTGCFCSRYHISNSISGTLNVSCDTAQTASEAVKLRIPR